MSTTCAQFDFKEILAALPYNSPSTQNRQGIICDLGLGLVWFLFLKNIIENYF